MKKKVESPDPVPPFYATKRLAALGTSAWGFFNSAWLLKPVPFLIIGVVLIEGVIIWKKLRTQERVR